MKNRWTAAALALLLTISTGSITAFADTVPMTPLDNVSSTDDPAKPKDDIDGGIFVDPPLPSLTLDISKGHITIMGGRVAQWLTKAGETSPTEVVQAVANKYIITGKQGTNSFTLEGASSDIDIQTDILFGLGDMKTTGLITIKEGNYINSTRISYTPLGGKLVQTFYQVAFAVPETAAVNMAVGQKLIAAIDSVSAGDKIVAADGKVHFWLQAGKAYNIELIKPTKFGARSLATAQSYAVVATVKTDGTVSVQEVKQEPEPPTTPSIPMTPIIPSTPTTPPNVPAAPDFAGDGTVTSPFVITSADDLAKVEKVENAGKYYKLDCNIFLPPTWGSIAFTGKLDGNFQTIALSGKPLFNSIASGGSVSYLKLSGSSTQGMVAATNAGTIKNVTATSVGVSGSGDVGGIVNTNTGTIEGSTFEGNVTSSGNAGGIAGTNSGTILSTTANVTTGGTVTGIGAGAVGGIAGTNSGEIRGTSNVGGMVTSTGAGIVGGIAGTNSGTIFGGSTRGTVKGTATVGGIAGANTGTINGANVNATVSGTIAGGIAGTNTSMNSVKESTASGSVSGTSVAGGAVGTNTGAITDVTTSNSVNGSTVGGIAGNSSGSITASSATGAITATTSGNAGGLVGVASAGTISKSFSNSTVKAEGGNAGGIAGSNAGSIDNTFVIGGVFGSNAGGLVGYNYTNGSIRGSYATGLVSGSSAAGGIVGYLTGGVVSSNYSVSTVKDNGNNNNNWAGGIVGSATSGFVTNCMALNPTISGSVYRTGRISGSAIISTRSLIPANSAAETTRVNGAVPAASIENGNSLTLAQLANPATFSSSTLGLGTNAGWVFPVYGSGLPSLGTVIPGSPQSGSIPLPPNLQTSTGGGGGGGGGGDYEPPYSETFWAEMKDKIDDAKSGAKIKFSSSKLDNMPTSVLKLLKDKNVTLEISHDGETIKINGKRMHPIPQNRVYYTFDALADLYANQPAASSKPASSTAKPVAPPAQSLAPDYPTNTTPIAPTSPPIASSSEEEIESSSEDSSSEEEVIAEESSEPDVPAEAEPAVPKKSAMPLVVAGIVILLALLGGGAALYFGYYRRRDDE